MKKLTALPVDTDQQVQIKPETMPGYVVHNFTQVIHKTIWQAWNDPAVRAEYEQWKRERQEAGIVCKEA